MEIHISVLMLECFVAASAFPDTTCVVHGLNPAA